MNKTFHIITHTHWDREWHKTFEQFRFILVDLMDNLLDILEKDEDYQCFHLDGQTVILEDYLEIKPENRQRIEALVKKRKLFIGPWYVLPDEFLVSGEAIIRNLLCGHAIARQFGRAMKVGYIPDSFGHISQMPQIFQGFGIDNVILWRGFGGEPGQEKSEYEWRAPNGTNALMLHLPQGGYARDFIATLNHEEIGEKMDSIFEKLLSRATLPHLLMLQGSDHLWAFPQLPELVDYLNTRYPEHRFVHSSLENFMKSVRSAKINFPEISGEHRFGYHFAPLLQGVYSSRMYLKIANEKCQTALEKFAEPLNAINVLQGNESHKQFLNLAWKYVLQNHPHDSICGCSIDSVHRENMIRFEKAEQISLEVINRAMSEILDTKNDSEKDAVNIFNPSPYSWSEPVECTIDFPVDEFHEDIPDFSLLNARNEPVVHQILSTEDAFRLEYLKYDYMKQSAVKRIRLLIDGRELLPLSFSSFQIIKESNNNSLDSTFKIGRFFLENKYVRVDIGSRGEIEVTDKIAGFTCDRINVFEDSADTGDEYNFCPPEKDEILRSTEFVPRLSVVEEGPLRGAIRVRTRMKLPQSISPDRKSRATEKKVLKISSIVRLDYNSPIVHFDTTVENECKDHRLRVLFRTHIKSSESHAEIPFHVISRHHRTYDPAEFEIEIPSSTHPMQRFVTAADQEKGFTLFSKGMPEYEFIPQRQGTFALTLLRCVNTLSSDDLSTRPSGNAGPQIETPEAQCHGKFRFKYAFLLHGPDLESEWAKIHDYAEWHNSKPAAIQSNVRNEIAPVFSLEPRILRLSAFKEAEDSDGFVIRLYNPSNSKTQGKITFSLQLKKAFKINLNEEIEHQLKLENSQHISIELKPWEIYSLRVIL